MENLFSKIGKKWAPYGLRGIWRNDAGDIFIDDGKYCLGVYYFGVIADIKNVLRTDCRFKDMPSSKTGLTPLWTE